VGIIAWRAGAASMEPLFFKAENSPSWKALDKSSNASMEPLFFKAENVGGVLSC